MMHTPFVYPLAETWTEVYLGGGDGGGTYCVREFQYLTH